MDESNGLFALFLCAHIYVLTVDEYIISKKLSIKLLQIN